jgi:hypothetical protein
LDVLHVASAAGLSDLDALVSYDQRVLPAAGVDGCAVGSPR